MELRHPLCWVRLCRPNLLANGPSNDKLGERGGQSTSSYASLSNFFGRWENECHISTRPTAGAKAPLVNQRNPSNSRRGMTFCNAAGKTACANSSLLLDPVYRGWGLRRHLPGPHQRNQSRENHGNGLLLAKPASIDPILSKSPEKPRGTHKNSAKCFPDVGWAAAASPSFRQY